MTRPRAVVVVALLIAVAVCVPVFFAALFAASGLIDQLAAVVGLRQMSPNAGTGTALVGQFLSVLAAMGMTYATFAGLRWVWQGTRLSRK